MLKKTIHIYGALESVTSTSGRYICDKWVSIYGCRWLLLESDSNALYCQTEFRNRLTLMKRAIDKPDNIVISGSFVDYGN